MAQSSPFSKLIQIGVVVSDLKKAIAYYEALGVGPFRTLDLDSPFYKQRKAFVLGRPVDPESIRNKIAVGDMGGIELELMEPGPNKSLWRDFLHTKGEGLHHLGFSVDDIEKATAELEAKGLKPLYTVKLPNGGGAAYFQAATSDVFLELLELRQSSRPK